MTCDIWLQAMVGLVSLHVEVPERQGSIQEEISSKKIAIREEDMMVVSEVDCKSSPLLILLSSPFHSDEGRIVFLTEI